jgi:nicotinate-nucleotide adenylyltransferase
MSRERIGLFGGTFDPPHVGHLILASEACSQLGLTRLLWMLTPTSPLKLGQKISPLEVRRAMVERAIAGNDAFELSLLEAERPAPQYTLDTVCALQERHPAAGIVLLIGGDSLGDLPKWRQPAELLAACEQIGVMRRPDSPDNLPELEKKIPGLTAKVKFVDAPLLEIASSEVRRRVRAGEPFRYYLPEMVYEYILEQKLYAR